MGHPYLHLFQDENLLSEAIEFYPIHHRSFNDILEHSLSFKIDPKEAWHGTLQLNHDVELGRGAFKTVYPGYLTLNHLRDEGLGQKRGERIAVKRMFYTDGKNNRGKSKIKRYTGLDDKTRVCREGTLHFTADALMDFAYAFIARENKVKGPPPFEIPEIRFVEAGVILVHGALGTSGPSTAGPSTIRHAYLVEELIEEDHLDNFFIKYLHNASAKPVLQPNHPRWELSQFLCFVQHVQYEKTNGLVYISDFQGML